MFRPCIDLHEGKVKQIVGASLDGNSSGPRTNFVSDKPSTWYAELYKRDGLKGGHIIMLGPGNETVAREGLRSYPGGLQVGGGITNENAHSFLGGGASHVLVTSWVFRDGKVDWDRLKELSKQVGKQRLVLDLSCRKRGEEYFVVTDRWQKFTELALGPGAFEKLADVSQLPAYSDRAVEAGKLYRYAISALDHSGNESGRSATVEAGLHQ